MKIADEVLNELKKENYRNILKDIYVDETILDYQISRYQKAILSFQELYGQKEIGIYSAPGRTEVGGNHTDHQHGQVLAAAVNLDMIAIVAKTDDNTIKIQSDDFDIAPIMVSYLGKKPEEIGTSEALVRGVAFCLQKMGYKVQGFQAYMTSDVFMGAGLSSSAAFEVMIGTIISGLFNKEEISPVQIAQAGQFAEREYFGKPCGLMDQMASSVGGLVHIDFKNTVNPKVEKLNVDFEKYGHSLCIIDTKGSHEDLTNEYAAIPQEMKKVASYFHQEFLEEVNESKFYDELNTIREKTGDRAILRAIHYFEECKRVEKEVNALQEDDFTAFKKWVKESGDSSYKYLQNIYANSDIQNQSMSLALFLSEQILGDKGVCRVHGGGFAGTIQAFVPNDMVIEYKDKIEKYFGKNSCHILKIRKYGGRKIV